MTGDYETNKEAYLDYMDSADADSGSTIFPFHIDVASPLRPYVKVTPQDPETPTTPGTSSGTKTFIMPKTGAGLSVLGLFAAGSACLALGKKKKH